MAFGVTLIDQIINRLVGVEPGKPRHVIGCSNQLIVTVQNRFPAVVGTQGPEIIIKPCALGIRSTIALRFETPHFYACRLIADLFEHLRKGDFRCGHRPAFAAGGIASGQQSGA